MRTLRGGGATYMESERREACTGAKRILDQAPAISPNRILFLGTGQPGCPFRADSRRSVLALDSPAMRHSGSIYGFEGVDERLSALPSAARRALAIAGEELS